MVAAIVACFALFASLANGQTCKYTSEDIEGPYYKPNAPTRPGNVVCDKAEMVNGTQLLVHGRIRTPDCWSPQAAHLDVWQANPQGGYSDQEDKSGPNFWCRGQLDTDAEGNYQFLTTIPGSYMDGDAYRPAHIHFKVSKADTPGENPLTTQLYFIEDPYIETDPCAPYCHAGDDTLTFYLEAENNAQSYSIGFDIILSE
jgi:protocatechuate 3,4-dioxygenase beta subunit